MKKFPEELKTNARLRWDYEYRIARKQGWRDELAVIAACFRMPRVLRGEYAGRNYYKQRQKVKRS